MGVVCKASFNTPPPGTSPTHSPLLRPGRTLTLCAAYSESEDPGLPLHYTWPYLAQVTWSTCKLLPHTLPPPQEVFGVCSGVEVQGLLCHFLCVRGKAFHLSLHLPSAKWLRFPAPQELSCVWKAPAVESAGPMSGVMIVVRVLCLALPSRLVPQGQPHSLVLLANFYTQLYRHQKHQSWFCEAAWLMEITGALSLADDSSHFDLLCYFRALVCSATSWGGRGDTLGFRSGNHSGVICLTPCPFEHTHTPLSNALMPTVTRSGDSSRGPRAFRSCHHLALADCSSQATTMAGAPRLTGECRTWVDYN